LLLEVFLDDDKLAKHYDLDSGIPKVMRGKVSLIADVNNSVLCFPDKNYEFEVASKGYYDGSGGCNYVRRLTLPRELINDYAIDANMGIELILNEVVYRAYGAEDVSKIFSERMEQGSLDFVPKEISGVDIPSLELLITTKFSDEFYDKLAFEINSAFRVGLFTATMVLVRKLFERLIIDLLRIKYGMREKELFYSEDDCGFHSFSKLIRNLKAKTDDFKPYDFLGLEREKESFLKFLWNIKEEGNASAHSIEPLLDRNGISDLKPSIDKYSDLLIRMIQKVKDTPK